MADRLSPRAPTSAILHDLLRDAHDETVTLGWLIGSLGDRSFGIILLLLGFLAMLPGVSAIVGVIIAIPAYQMVVARRVPTFPGFLAAKTFRKERLAAILSRAIPVLRLFETFIRPRWQTQFQMTKRVVGAAILLVGITLFAPVPLSNVAPALIIVLVAFAYLEEDGVLLAAALFISLALLLVALAIVWETMSAAGWVKNLL